MSVVLPVSPDCADDDMQLLHTVLFTQRSALRTALAGKGGRERKYGTVLRLRSLISGHAMLV